MLDNRKLGELPEINGKLVKVKQATYFVDFRRGVCLVWFYLRVKNEVRSDSDGQEWALKVTNDNQ